MMEPERDQASQAGTGDILTRHTDEVAAGISSITNDLGALSRQLADLHAALQGRLDELNQRETAISGREADLDRQSKELAEAEQRLDAGGGELEQARSELEARAAELAARETKLAAREEAVLEFQATMADVMQAFGAPRPRGLPMEGQQAAGTASAEIVPAQTATGVNADPPEDSGHAGDAASSDSNELLQGAGKSHEPADSAVPDESDQHPAADLIEEYGSDPPIQQPDDGHQTPSEQSDDGQDTSVEQTSGEQAGEGQGSSPEDTEPDPPVSGPREAPGSVSEPEAAAPHEPETTTTEGGEPSTPESIDAALEAELDEDTRQKLKVLRRLTGGRVSDQELLARISGEHEPAPAAAPASGKPKRRWWSG
jgi:hypothetical protein